MWKLTSSQKQQQKQAPELGVATSVWLKGES